MTDVNKEAELPEFAVFTNAEDKRPLQTLMWGFHSGIMQNRIGIMQALNSVTGQEEILLVGLSLDENGELECFPLAKAISAEEAGAYRTPDGKGGYVDATVQ